MLTILCFSLLKLQQPPEGAPTLQKDQRLLPNRAKLTKSNKRLHPKDKQTKPKVSIFFLTPGSPLSPLTPGKRGVKRKKRSLRLLETGSFLQKCFPRCDPRITR